MVTYLLKKSYQHKNLKEITFKDLWGDKGMFTTMWIFGKPAKILFFKKHIKNLIKSLKYYKLNKPNLEKNILKLLKKNIKKNKEYNHLLRIAVNNKIIGAQKGSSAIMSYKNLLEQFIFGKQHEYLYNHVGKDPEPLGEAIHYTNPVHKHYCCKSDGSYNMNDRKIHMDAFLGKMPLQFKDPTSLLFISVPYEELDTDTNYRWILNTPMDELLSSRISIVETIKRELV